MNRPSFFKGGLEFFARIRRKFKSAARLLLNGEYREVIGRVWANRGGLVDLEHVELERLGLPPERSERHDVSTGRNLEIIFENLRVRPGDAIVDLGCGKGGAIITIAKFPFSKIAGVEISEELIQTAKRNLLLLRIKNIALYCCDAASFKELDEFNYIYMFNPFPAAVMSEVVKNIAASLERNTRPMTIVYNNPVCEEIIMKSGLFNPVQQFDHCWNKVVVYRTL